MKKTLMMMALAAASLQATAATTQEYVYTPVAGVHEVKHFHGCWDSADLEKRPKIHVLMQGLSSGDVVVQTTPQESGKPSTEMVTFKLKNMDASFKVQFRSNDGPHCQQGVASIRFSDTVLHSAGQLNSMR